MFSSFALHRERDGDRIRVTRLYKQYQRQLHRLAARLLGPGPKAEDAVHDTFIKFLQHYDQLCSRSDDQLERWLMVVVRNTALDTLRKEGSKLQGHPSMTKCPGIDISTGSLGQGLACAAGMAMAAKMDRKDYKVFCVVGDGEAQEGEIWEAANTANKYHLDNLITFVDFNNLQLDGACDEIMPNGDLGEKFRAFGWETIEIDGHSMEEIVAALDKCYASKNGKPKCIYGHTIKGKGVSFMENQCGWHGVAPNKEQYEQAMAELKAQLMD